MSTRLTGGVSVSVGQSLPLQTTAERAPDPVEAQRRREDNLSASIRVAIPAKIVEWFPEKQTITAQPLIREKIKDLLTGAIAWMELPQLHDVPVSFPQGQNFCLTFPVEVDDEVLIVFNDLSIESWQELGEIQNWVDKRRHDLSDGIALLGVNSKPNIIEHIATDAAELRTKDRKAVVRIKDDYPEIAYQAVEPVTGAATPVGYVRVTEEGPELVGVTVKIAAATLILAVPEVITLNDDPLKISAGSMEFNSNSTMALNGVLMLNGAAYLSHRHPGVQTGGGITGSVTP